MNCKHSQMTLKLIEHVTNYNRNASEGGKLKMLCELFKLTLVVMCK